MMKGCMDTITLFNRVLSADEINTLYNSGTPLDPRTDPVLNSNIEVYYPFDGDYLDHGPNDYHLTQGTQTFITNTPTFSVITPVSGITKTDFTRASPGLFNGYHYTNEQADGLYNGNYIHTYNTSTEERGIEVRSIDGTIIANTTQSLTGSNYNTIYPVVMVDDDNIMLVYVNDNKLYAKVVDSNLNIIVDSTLIDDTNSYSNVRGECIHLGNNTVVTALSNGTTFTAIIEFTGDMIIHHQTFVQSSSASKFSSIAPLQNMYFVVGYQYLTGNANCYYKIFHWSGSQLTHGSNVNVSSFSVHYPKVASNRTGTLFAVLPYEYGQPNNPYIHVYSFDGTSTSSEVKETSMSIGLGDEAQYTPIFITDDILLTIRGYQSGGNRIQHTTINWETQTIISSMSGSSTDSYLESGMAFTGFQSKSQDNVSHVILLGDKILTVRT